MAPKEQNNGGQAKQPAPTRYRVFKRTGCTGPPPATYEVDKTYPEDANLKRLAQCGLAEIVKE